MKSEETKYLYDNITISGLPGSGNTTLLNKLKEALKFDGWKGFSGGEFMRAYCIEKGLMKDYSKLHHNPMIYGPDFDRKVDMGIREKLGEERKWIIEAKLSGFFAQGLPKVLKVLMHCSDDSVRIDRIVNRDSVTPEEAISNFESRLAVYRKKWVKIYKDQWRDWVVKPGIAKAEDPIDFWRKDLYDISIDTYSNNQQQCLEIVLNAIKEKKSD